MFNYFSCENQLELKGLLKKLRKMKTNKPRILFSFKND